MTTGVKWGTLIADENGVIDGARLRALVSIALAIAGAIPLVLAMLGRVTDCGGAHLPLGAGILVAPLTSGRVVDAIRGLTSKGGASGEIPGG